MTTFERLSARDSRFIDTKNSYFEPLNMFYEYAEMLTKKAGRVKVRSNKAKDYRDYLVRFIIFYEDIFEDNISNLLTLDSLNKFEKIYELDGFKDFNQTSHNFYSATLNCFRSFLIERINSAEILSDEILNIELSKLPTILEDSTVTSKAPKSKPNKSLSTMMGKAYPRDIEEALQAKKNSNWKCELDNTHSSFISETDGKTFVEAHHLIPMAAQDKFKYSLDFADNIVSLCPNCHRLVHHSTRNIRKRALEKLFASRKHLYKEHGITIDQKTLLTYYGINQSKS